MIIWMFGNIHPMSKAQRSDARDAFEHWNPGMFNRDALYQRTIRTFTGALISGNVLDVGCGSRIFCDLRQAGSWTGIDISERMLSGIEFIDDVSEKRVCQGDVLDLEFSDDSFDTVTALFLLHHLGRDNRRESAERVQQAFREIYRVLKPGGNFLLAENCRGFLEAPYHWLYPAFYYLGKRFARTELPYFWKHQHYSHFGACAGFAETVFIHVPIRERIYQPVLNISIPPVFSHDFIQKMTVFNFVKSDTGASAGTSPRD